MKLKKSQSFFVLVFHAAVVADTPRAYRTRRAEHPPTHHPGLDSGAIKNRHMDSESSQGWRKKEEKPPFRVTEKGQGAHFAKKYIFVKKGIYKNQRLCNSDKYQKTTSRGTK